MVGWGWGAWRERSECYEVRGAFWESRNVVKLVVVMAARLCEYTTKH